MCGRCALLLAICGVCGAIEALETPRTLASCVDIPGWLDAEGATCEEYASKLWCTADGMKGSGWPNNMGDLEDQWNQGYTAQSACCICGGGQVPIAGAWQVLRGNCSIDAEGCLVSPNYPQNYSDNEKCTILVNSTLTQPVHASLWDVEYWYDYLLINGKLFSGRYKPDGQRPNGSIHWASDEDITGQGWKLCWKVPNTLSPLTSSSSTASPSTVGSTSTSEPVTMVMTEAPTGMSTSSAMTTSTPDLDSTSEDDCKDLKGWTDSVDFSCSEYEERQWCTARGEPGPNWVPVWGELEDYWSFGFDASVACCACGGGNIGPISTMWAVMVGDCTVHDGCIQSPNYPANYSNNERCTILVNPSLAKPIEVVAFATEHNYDRLSINGRYFSGRKKPSGVVPLTAISWESDEDTTAKGWKLCPGSFTRGPSMFSTSSPCTVDAEGCARSPNYPARYGPVEDCTIQVYNPENKSMVVEQFSTEMLYDVLWVNGRMYAGAVSPHGLVPTEAIQWSSDEDTEDVGWKLCPGPVGQQVPDVGGLDEPGRDEYGYSYSNGQVGAGEAPSQTQSTGPHTTEEPAGSLMASHPDSEDGWGGAAGAFVLKVVLAVAVTCLAGVLCLRCRQNNEQSGGYGTRYGRSYALDNL